MDTARWAGLVVVAVGMGACSLGGADDLQRQIAALAIANGRLAGEVAEVRAQLAAPGPWSSWKTDVALERVGSPDTYRAFERRFASGEVLDGFFVRAKDLVQALVPVCAPYQPISGAQATTRFARDLALVGETADFPAVQTRCEPGRHVVGVHGRAGLLIDALGWFCQAPGGPRTRTAPTGGSGGTEFERLCPDGWVAVGVSGTAGDRLGSLSLHCADPAVEPVPGSPAVLE